MDDFLVAPLLGSPVADVGYLALETSEWGSLSSQITPANPPPFAPARLGEKYPPFEMKTVDGKTFRSKDCRGVLVIDFWAEYCAPCLVATRTLKEITEKLAKTNKDPNQILTVLTVNADFRQQRDAATRKKIATFPSSWYNVVAPLEGKQRELFFAAFTSSTTPALPFILAIDREGKLHRLAEKGVADLEKEVWELIKR